MARAKRCLSVLPRPHVHNLEESQKSQMEGTVFVTLSERPRLICGEGVPVGSKHFITEQVFLKLIASPVSPHFLITKPISFLAKGREDRTQIGFANSDFFGDHSSKPEQVCGGRRRLPSLGQEDP